MGACEIVFSLGTRWRHFPLCTPHLSPEARREPHCVYPSHRLTDPLCRGSLSPSRWDTDVDAVSEALETRFLGRPAVDHRHTVETTMDLAAAALRDGGQAAHGSVFSADVQTRGVARRGRDWVSPDQGNLYFSFVWAPASVPPGPDLLREMSKLNFCISLATVAAARSLGVQARVKWPNDVHTDNGKLSGMLVNYDGQTGAVAGVGINVNMVSSNGTCQLGRPATPSNCVCSRRDLDGASAVHMWLRW